MKRFNKNQKGQAVIEMALSLPFLIWLIYYTINAYLMIHTASIGQKSAAMSLYQRLDKRAIYAVDGVEQTLTQRNFMAVQYRDPASNSTPIRKILVGPVNINATVGICREPRCN